METIRMTVNGTLPLEIWTILSLFLLVFTSDLMKNDLLIVVNFPLSKETNKYWDCILLIELTEQREFLTTEEDVSSDLGVRDSSLTLNFTFSKIPKKDKSSTNTLKNITESQHNVNITRGRIAKVELKIS